ncbi:RICIN domain-containing protein [Collinsella sp. LCP21S3_A3]|uniref:RICIN domain-containing protein n=1 Tax=Collinsella sp. LCP21S3_A3 TaxID=3438769 RepID=UPI003F91D7A0
MLTATSNVTTVSSYQWSAKFDFEVEYPETPAIPDRVIDDGEYRMASCADTSVALGCSGGSAVLTSSAATVSIARDETTGMCRVSALGRVLRAEGWSARFAVADGSRAELWEHRREAGAYVLVSADTGLALDVPGGSAQDGKGIQTWTPNGTPAQSWELEAI